jgi:PAS domain S-box-containing protein
MLDLQGRIGFASSALCELLGTTPEDIAGVSCFDFVFPENVEQAKALFESNKVPHAEPFRFKLRRRDGSAVWADVQADALRPANGQVYGIVATVTPVKV